MVVLRARAVGLAWPERAVSDDASERDGPPRHERRDDIGRERESGLRGRALAAVVVECKSDGARVEPGAVTAGRRPGPDLDCKRVPARGFNQDVVRAVVGARCELERVERVGVVDLGGVDDDPAGYHSDSIDAVSSGSTRPQRRARRRWPGLPEAPVSALVEARETSQNAPGRTISRGCGREAQFLPRARPRPGYLTMGCGSGLGLTD